jgi:predicted phage-related endonuclease
MIEKKDIEYTRIGSLGSSDAAMVLSVGKSGVLTQTAKKRLAVLLGQRENSSIATFAMRLGDEIEEVIYNILKKKYGDNIVSNPYYELEDKRYPFKIISHIDYEIVVGDTLVWIENKASVSNTDDVLATYSAQLAWHRWLGERKAKSMGKKFQLFLSHYNTSDYDGAFDSEKLTFKKVIVKEDFSKGLEIIKKEIEGGFVYDDDTSEIAIADISNCEMTALLEEVRMACLVIKREEEKVAEARELLMRWMEEENIQKIKGEDFSITVKEPSVSYRLDTKKIKAEHPRIYKKYLAETQIKKSLIIKTS